MTVENGSEPTLKDVMLTVASIKSTVDGINNRICRVEERLYKVEEKLCKVGDLEIKVVSLEESQDFLSKRYEEQDKNIKEIKDTNSRLQKENDILWSKIHLLTKGLAEEQLKRNNLEQYGRREMIEIRDRRQKTFGFLSRLCLLRGAGGQDKSAKNRQFPDKSLLF